MAKTLSIVIPSCNMEKYLGQSLDSLIVPDINDVEILVVNDGSKDRTSEIAHRYEKRYPETIRVIDKTNGHYGSCINRGLKEASGKYIKILDADDSFDSAAFEKFITFLNNTDADLVLTNYCIVDENHEVTEYRSINGESHIGKVICFDEAWDIISGRLMAMHCVCYRREMLIAMGYSQTEGVAYTDQEWIFEPMTKVERVAFCPVYLYRYLVGRMGQSVSAEVIRKNMGLQIKLISKRVGIAAKEREMLSETHFNYLEKRLEYALANTYRTILFSKDFAELKPLLATLDKEILQGLPELYETLGNMKLKSWLPFYFVKHWRRKISKN